MIRGDILGDGQVFVIVNYKSHNERHSIFICAIIVVFFFFLSLLKPFNKRLCTLSEHPSLVISLPNLSIKPRDEHVLANYVAVIERLQNAVPMPMQSLDVHSERFEYAQKHRRVDVLSRKPRQHRTVSFDGRHHRAPIALRTHNEPTQRQIRLRALIELARQTQYFDSFKDVIARCIDSARDKTPQSTFGG